MDSLYEKKNRALDAVNDLMLVITNLESDDNSVIDELNKKNECLNQMNKQLISEIAEKDKHMSIQQQTITDYEGHIQELSKVKEEENKFGMLKAVDKENSNLNKEIESLKKELEQANSKLEVMSGDNSVSCEMNDVVEDTPVVEEEEEEEEEEETTVVKEDGEDEKEEEDDSDGVVYVSKKINKVKYYVEKDNPNSKIYKILDDGDVGGEVGEIINGKKKLYP